MLISSAAAASLDCAAAYYRYGLALFYRSASLSTNLVLLFVPRKRYFNQVDDLWLAILLKMHTLQGLVLRYLTHACWILVVSCHLDLRSPCCFIASSVVLVRTCAATHEALQKSSERLICFSVTATSSIFGINYSRVAESLHSASESNEEGFDLNMTMTHKWPPKSPTLLQGPGREWCFWGDSSVGSDKAWRWSFNSSAGW